MFRRLLLVLGITLFAAFAQAAGEPPPDVATAAHAVLEKLVGHWVLTGTISRQQTTHHVDAEWILQDNYVRLAETSRERDANGKPQYEAVILIGWLKDHYVCFWFDNTEVASGDITGRAAFAPDAIPLEFRDSKGVLSFTNTFVYDRAHDTWEWRMANVKDGTSTPFALVSLHRR